MWLPLATQPGAFAAWLQAEPPPWPSRLPCSLRALQPAMFSTHGGMAPLGSLLTSIVSLPQPAFMAGLLRSQVDRPRRRLRCICDKCWMMRASSSFGSEARCAGRHGCLLLAGRIWILHASGLTAALGSKALGEGGRVSARGTCRVLHIVKHGLCFPQREGYDSGMHMPA